LHKEPLKLTTNGNKTNKQLNSNSHTKPFGKDMEYENKEDGNMGGGMVHVQFEIVNEPS